MSGPAHLSRCLGLDRQQLAWVTIAALHSNGAEAGRASHMMHHHIIELVLLAWVHAEHFRRMQLNAWSMLPNIWKHAHVLISLLVQAILIGARIHPMRLVRKLHITRLTIAAGTMTSGRRPTMWRPGSAVRRPCDCAAPWHQTALCSVAACTSVWYAVSKMHLHLQCLWLGLCNSVDHCSRVPHT